jgi:hypothetical protein
LRLTLGLPPQKEFRFTSTLDFAFDIPAKIFALNQSRTVFLVLSKTMLFSEIFEKNSKSIQKNKT